MPEDRDLHLLRLRLETRRLFELGRRRRLPLRDVDLGYLVHCELGELFGDHAPKPFRTRGYRAGGTEVFAYSEIDPAELRDHARTYADPAVWETCDWGSFAGKPMPSAWPTGKHLGFEVRTCPIVRKAGEGPRHRRGAEVDAFLARAWEAPAEDLRRETVYLDWLTNRLDGHGVRLVNAHLEAFRLARLLRRRHGRDRKASLCDRPDALLRGTLEVTDGERFGRLLARGIGRHRAFGFGMLLLRPAS